MEKMGTTIEGVGLRMKEAFAWWCFGGSEEDLTIPWDWEASLMRALGSRVPVTERVPV